jgi:hypothetical protein
MKGGPEQYLKFFLLWSLENPILNNYMVVSQVPGEIRSLKWHKLEINTFLHLIVFTEREDTENKKPLWRQY